VKRTEGFTGDDIKDMFDSAKQDAVYRVAKTAKQLKELKDTGQIRINPDDVLKCVKACADEKKANTTKWEFQFKEFIKSSDMKDVMYA
jgi:SpoVK/Ycf46/Vps4 family AAA+-type ATPase